MIYILAMNDENVVNLSAQYIDNILNCYKSLKDDGSFSSSNVTIYFFFPVKIVSLIEVSTHLCMLTCVKLLELKSSVEDKVNKVNY